MRRIHPDDDLPPQALELATRMAERPPEALFETKRLTREVISLDSGTFAQMFEAISERLRSAEHRGCWEPTWRGWRGGRGAGLGDPAEPPRRVRKLQH